jgi:hypothetical protein
MLVTGPPRHVRHLCTSSHHGGPVTKIGFQLGFFQRVKVVLDYMCWYSYVEPPYIEKVHMVGKLAKLCRRLGA